MKSYDKLESESHSVVLDSLWSHRLYSPWNSPGQNTGVGSYFLFHSIFPTQGSRFPTLQVDNLPSELPEKPHKWELKKSKSESCSVVSDSLWPHGLYPARLLCPWNFPGKNIGVGCHFLLQGIFLTQDLNPGGSPASRADSLPSEPSGQPNYQQKPCVGN